MFAVAQLGARMHYAVPRILQSAGMLEHFYTDFAAVQPWSVLPGTLGKVRGASGALGRMAARVPLGIPADRITHWPAFATQYYLRQRRATTPEQLTNTFLWAGIEFCRRILRHGLGNARAVYTYNSAGLELMEHAGARGLLRVMEQTIVPVSVEDRLMAEEHSAWPGWGTPRDAGGARAAAADRERREWDQADLIVCGSEFVRRGISECDGPAACCVVVPYGVDWSFARASRLRAGPMVPTGMDASQARGLGRQQGRLRVLVVGEVSLRKGAPYVLAAARATKGLAEFWWCGRVGVPPAAARELQEHIGLRGVITRPEMVEHYAWADVFLLPSICEGSATVCYEALAAGLPVITTENAGSVVRDGIEGFIVPLRDSSAIVERLERLHGDRELWESMSRAALERASEFTLDKYGERLLSAVTAATASTT